MPKLRTIATEAAPAAIGPYSQAVRMGKWIYCSGQIPLDPASGEVVGTTAAEQAQRVLANLAAVLDAAGAGFDRVVKTTIFLKDLGDFAAVNEVYAGAFGDHRPARATVEVSRLPKDVLVEIEAIARRR
jgi:2-iminobutanoate/2-iminopropanoate deaminase